MKRSAGTALIAWLWIAGALAIAPTRAARAQTSETAIYFGLTITLGIAEGDPGVSIGVQHRHLFDDGKAAGMDLRLRLAPGRGLRAQDIRLSALLGVERAQLGLGMGYDFAQKGQFSTLSLQNQSARIGLDSYSAARNPVLWVEISPLRLAHRTED